MVLSCAFGCRNRGGEGLGLDFYRFPSKNGDRIRRWLQAIRREDWQATILCQVSEKSGSVAVTPLPQLRRCNRKEKN